MTNNDAPITGCLKKMLAIPATIRIKFKSNISAPLFGFVSISVFILILN
jgi:hypothetical protein